MLAPPSLRSLQQRHPQSLALDVLLAAFDGRATVLMLSKEGARVILCDVNEAGAKEPIKMADGAPVEFLEVELTDGDGLHETRTVDVNDARTDVSWSTKLRVRSVALDPHFLVLHWLPDLRASAAARPKRRAQTPHSRPP